jgi:VRR-NUC domain
MSPRTPRRLHSLPENATWPATAAQLDEKTWLEEVIDAAWRCGWQRRYHTFDSRRSTAGFPDLVLCRPPRLVFAECKRENGKLTVEQAIWLNDLDLCGMEVYVWRPSDRDTVDRILASRNRP